MPDVSKKTNLRKFITGYETDLKIRLASNLVVLGLVYGYISAHHNQNPYYPVPHSEKASLRKLWSELEQCNEYMSRAHTWRPSPLWFPSYLLCKLPPGEPGIGIFWSKSGYLFRSYAGLYLYRFSSTVLGGVLGLILAIIIINIKKVKQRKKQTESEDSPTGSEKVSPL